MSFLEVHDLFDDGYLINAERVESVSKYRGPTKQYKTVIICVSNTEDENVYYCTDDYRDVITCIARFNEIIHCPEVR